MSRVGGLIDTVIDANEAALAAGLERGIARLALLWPDQAAWHRMQGNAMRAEVGQAC